MGLFKNKESTRAAEPAEADGSVAPRKKKKKLGVAVGVAATVVVVAGAGLLVWHDQPSFCGAICHTPMDAYYDTYENGTADKYSNELDEQAASSMLAHVHKDAGATCVDCHVPTLGEQVTEGLSWVAGSYEVAGSNASGQAVLETRALSDLVEARGIDEEQFCLNDACHVGDDGAVLTREGLVKLTEGLDEDYNPHLKKHGEVPCSNCHKAHTQSVNYCTSCHSGAPIPEGWLGASKAKTIHTVAP